VTFNLIKKKGRGRRDRVPVFCGLGKIQGKKIQPGREGVDCRKFKTTPAEVNLLGSHLAHQGAVVWGLVKEAKVGSKSKLVMFKKPGVRKIVPGKVLRRRQKKRG